MSTKFVKLGLSEITMCLPKDRDVILTSMTQRREKWVFHVLTRTEF